MGFRDISGRPWTLCSWTPDTDVYRQVIASGQLLLTDGAELRFDLAGYHSALNRVGEIVKDISKQYFLELEPFSAKSTVYTDVARSKWLEEIPAPPFFD